MYTLNVFLSMQKFSNTGVGNQGVIKTFTILDSANNQTSLSPNLSVNHHGHREREINDFPGTNLHFEDGQQYLAYHHRRILRRLLRCLQMEVGSANQQSAKSSYRSS